MGSADALVPRGLFIKQRIIALTGQLVLGSVTWKERSNFTQRQPEESIHTDGRSSGLFPVYLFFCFIIIILTEDCG